MIKTLRNKDGSYYNGSVNERGQCHGYGTMHWGENWYFSGKWSYDEPVSGTFYDNGYRYEGEVTSDNGNFKITGNGTSYLNNGNIYVGYHRNGAPSCKGTYYYTNGDIEKGFWADGRLSEGKYILANGSFCKGTFHQDESTNRFYGEIRRYDGTIYKGRMINWKKEGSGTAYYYKKKMDYQGEWKNDLKHGNGTLYSRNGDVYTGGFKDDDMHGKGTAEGVGFSLSGKWVNGLKEGKFYVVYTFRNVKAVVIYKNDKLIETISETVIDENVKFDKIKYNNGSLYVGEVKNGKPNGIGVLYPKEDDKTEWYNGNFINGKLIGKGIFESKDYRYEGQFKNGKITGQGIMSHKDKKGATIGFFKNGIPHGYCRLSKQISGISFIEGIYSGSKFKGNVKISYDDKRVYYGQVKGFIPNGQGIMEYPDGSTVIGVFKKGIPNGPVTILENNKKYDGHYKKGKCIKKREWLLEV